MFIIAEEKRQQLKKTKLFFLFKCELTNVLSMKTMFAKREKCFRSSKQNVLTFKRIRTIWIPAYLFLLSLKKFIIQWRQLIIDTISFG